MESLWVSDGARAYETVRPYATKESPIPCIVLAEQLLLWWASGTRGCL